MQQEILAGGCLQGTHRTLLLLRFLPSLYKPSLLWDVLLNTHPSGKPGTCSGEPWLQDLVLYLSHDLWGENKSESKGDSENEEERETLSGIQETSRAGQELKP